MQINYYLPPNSLACLLRTVRLCLPALLAWLLILPAQAQRLGGIPDPTFNMKDSGLAVPALKYKNQMFFPGPSGGIFVAARQTLHKYGTRSIRQNQGVTYFNKLMRSGTADGFYGYSGYIGVGAFMDAGQGKYYMLSGQNVYSGTIGDSIAVRPVRNIGQPRAGIYKFLGFRSLRGYTNTGIGQTSPNQLAFWITSHATDSIAPHNQTIVYALDTGGRYQGRKITLPNFKAEKSAVHQGNIYLLGRAIVDDSVPGDNQMYILQGGTLANLSSPMINTQIASLFYGPRPAQIFYIQADGKMVVAGNINGAVITGEQAVRLLANGQPDPSWGFTALPGASGTKWCQDSLGTLRCATANWGVDENGGTATWAVVQPNGGLTSRTNVPLPAQWPSCRPLMYQPSGNAFLYETGDLYPQIEPYLDPRYYADSTYAHRHRFYVSSARQIYPLVKHKGVGFQYENFQFKENVAKNKLVVTGMITQVNGRLLPGLAVMNADGTVDTTFQGLLSLPNDKRGNYLSWNEFYAHMTNSGKVLGYFPAGNGFNNGDTTLNYTTRFLANGQIDPGYTPVLAQGTVTPRKRGDGFVALRVIDPQTGQIVPPYSYWFNTIGETSIVEMDGEGNLRRVYGSYIPTGFPDTVGPQGSIQSRYRVLVGEDDQKGVFAQHSWGAPTGDTINTWRSRTYYVRYDTNGRTRIIYSSAYTVVGSLLKVEILAGKRMRMTGLFNLKDTTLAGRYVNVIETDSLGQLDLAMRPIAYLVPDAYGARGGYSLTPIRYMPDGKILSSLARTGLAQYVVRHFADGRYDPTFLPVAYYDYYYTSFGVLGDRLYLGGTNFNNFNPVRRYYTYGTAAKNGIAAFTISMRPANTGYVLGRVEQVRSPATGCAPTGLRKPARNMIVRAQPSGRIAIADTGGNYTLALDTGSYQVSQQIENNFLQRQVCPAANAPRLVSLGGNGVAQIGQDFINQSFDCPRLDLQVLQPRFRLCSKGYIRLQYQNDGMAPEPAARIRLNLPAEVRLLSANLAYRVDSDSSYVFDLGRLGVGQHGELLLRDTIACLTTPDSLARACFSARIEPLSLCSQIDPSTLAWDGAWLDAEGRYLPGTDQVRIVIRNRGTAMADSVPASLSSSGYSYLRGKIKLSAGDSLVYFVPPAIQGSVFLSLTQPRNCPLGSASTLFHSGRGTARAFLHFGSGLLETYTVQACPVFRYSYDPNEKLVEPRGEVEPGTRLSYTIHFENYGNDTAYAVSVQDSLPDGLDVNTIKLGGSSHPYQMVVEGTVAQPVLYFNFNPIKLTAKKQDSVRSKGQVSFTIRTKPSIARGSVVANRAHIYFDRNAAVITEYASTPIANLPVTAARLKATGGSGISIYPNPAQGSCRVQLTEKASTVPHHLQLLTLEGKLILERSLTTETTLNLQGLAPGYYTVLVEGFRPERLVIVR